MKKILQLEIIAVQNIIYLQPKSKNLEGIFFLGRESITSNIK